MERLERWFAEHVGVDDFAEGMWRGALDAIATLALDALRFAETGLSCPAVG